MRTFKRWGMACACAATVAAISWAKSPPTSRTVTPPDTAAVQAGVGSRELIKKIHAVNELEIRVGQIAVRKGQDPRVRRYGRLLWRDHRNADGRVLALARRLQLDVTAAKADARDAATLDKLEAATGAEFDRVLLVAMHEGHQQAIGLLESARQSDSPALRALVGKLLPILRQHDQVALDLSRPENAAGGRHG